MFCAAVKRIITISVVNTARLPPLRAGGVAMQATQYDPSEATRRYFFTVHCALDVCLGAVERAAQHLRQRVQN